MKPSRHIAVSFSLGVILLFFTKSIPSGIICFLSGILVDIDHIIEYIIHYGLKSISVDRVYHVCESCAFSKFYLVFHSIEIAIVAWLLTFFTFNIYVLAFALGYSSHILLDVIGNEFYPQGYFILWRVNKKFEAQKLFKENSKYRSKNGNT